MDQELKSVGSMKKESLKERGSNTTDNTLSECEGGNALYLSKEHRQSIAFNNLIALRKFCLHYLQVLALRKITKKLCICRLLDSEISSPRAGITPGTSSTRGKCLTNELQRFYCLFGDRACAFSIWE